MIMKAPSTVHQSRSKKQINENVQIEHKLSERTTEVKERRSTKYELEKDLQEYRREREPTTRRSLLEEEGNAGNYTDSQREWREVRVPGEQISVDDIEIDEGEYIEGDIDHSVIPTHLDTKSNIFPNRKQNTLTQSTSKTKSKRNCCCGYIQKLIKRDNKLDITKMKSIHNWKWILHRILLATRVVNALKRVRKNIEIYGAMGESQATHNQRIQSALNSHEPGIPTCILLPDSYFNWFWMFLIISLLMWAAIYLPYRLAFIDNSYITLFIMECIMDFIFLIDVGLNFFMAYYDNNNMLITDRKLIARRYLKSWFTIDLISSIPFQIFDSSFDMSKVARLLRLPRIYKIIKVIKLMKMFNFMKPSKLYQKYLFFFKLHSGVMRLSKVLILMSFFVHFYSCLWYFMAKIEGFQPECWIMQHGLLDSPNLDKYLTAFYWVLQTATTVGYGDMSVGNNTERIIAITLMIVGVSFYSYMIGNLSSIFSSMDTKEMKLNSKILALNEFALNLKMPSSLYFKIHRILKKNSDSGYLCFLDQDTLLNELPAALKNEIMCMTHEKILNSFSFFRGKAPSFVLDILHEFTHISLSPDEVIYRKGDWIEDTYFLLKGRVAFVTQEGYIFRNFVSGSYFGEVEHFKNVNSRNHSVMTMEETELLAIKTSDLDKILEYYPEIAEELKAVAIQRAVKNKDAIKIAKRVGFKIDPERQLPENMENIKCRLKILHSGLGSKLYEEFYNATASLEQFSSESEGEGELTQELRENILDSISEQSENLSRTAQESPDPPPKKSFSTDNVSALAHIRKEQAVATIKSQNKSKEYEDFTKLISSEYLNPGEGKKCRSYSVPEGVIEEESNYSIGEDITDRISISKYQSEITHQQLPVSASKSTTYETQPKLNINPEVNILLENIPPCKQNKFSDIHPDINSLSLIEEEKIREEVDSPNLSAIMRYKFKGQKKQSDTNVGNLDKLKRKTIYRTGITSKLTKMTSLPPKTRPRKGVNCRNSKINYQIESALRMESRRRETFKIYDLGGKKGEEISHTAQKETYPPYVEIFNTRIDLLLKSNQGILTELSLIHHKLNDHKKHFGKDHSAMLKW